MTLTGCQTLPGGEAFFEPVSLEQRQFQTRIYEASDEIRVLQASIALLLDNGFQINQAEGRLGWVHAYKPGTMGTEGWGQYRGAVFYATVVTSPVQDRSGVTQLRVTFHAASYEDLVMKEFADKNRPPVNNMSEFASLGFHLIDNPAVYQEFFSRLSKVLFLEAHRI